MRLLPLVLLTACSSPSTGDSAGGDGAAITDTAWPTGSRVMFFYGSGGAEPLGTGAAAFAQLEALCEDEWGWQFDHRDFLPDDLDSYRLIGLVAPGLNGGALSADDVSALRGAMGAGTRLLVMADVDDCGSTAVDDVLAQLGLSMRLSGDGTDANRMVTAETVNPETQPGAGVAAVLFRDPCYVDQNDADWVIKDPDRHVMAAVERPAPLPSESALPGDVVLVGDYGFLDDSGPLAEHDNAIFARNLMSVEP